MKSAKAQIHQQQVNGRSTTQSVMAYEAARAVLAGGVNSPVRAFGAVGGTPRFIAKAQGAVLTDLDGNDYIDYVGAWGPMILGHCDERVQVAATKVLDRGWSYGAPTLAETTLAEHIIADIRSIEVVRFVNSGTEATMSAVRLARGFTGRDLVLKCEGCYHGHVDYLLVQAGSGATTFGSPSSAGVPEAIASATLVVPYNNIDAARAVFAAQGPRIAALLIEPVAGNMGCIPPVQGYLEGLRELCEQYGSLLIFDEVMTGYRLGLSGAQGLYGIRPDITCLGKIIGGGFPVGAYGARREIMDRLSPMGPVYQAGTLSGNPLAMAAGIVTLEVLHEDGVYEGLREKATRLANGLTAAASEAGVDVYQTRVGSMATTFFHQGPVIDYASAKRSDTAAFGRFFHAMLDRGIYLPPSQFETWFVSRAHTDEQIERTIAAAADAFKQLTGGL